MKLLFARAVAVACLIGIGPAINPAAAQSTIAPPGTALALLDPAGNRATVHAFAVNASGVVAGDAEGNVYRWAPDGTPENMGFVGSARAINSAGDLAGLNSYSHAFFWSASTGPVDLATLGGDVSVAVGMTDSQWVAGTSDDAAGNHHSFVWSPTTGLTDIGTLGGPNARATAINEAGQVVGQSETADAKLHAFVWASDTGMVDLGVIDPYDGAEALDINDAGQVVGNLTSSSDGSSIGFMWSAATGMVTSDSVGCPTLPRLINNVGDMVGGPRNGTGLVVCPQGGTSFDIGPLFVGFGNQPPDGFIGEGVLPTGINDDGRVVGQVSDAYTICCTFPIRHRTVTGSYLWTPDVVQTTPIAQPVQVRPSFTG